jgi:hypothetical protein
LNIDSGTVGILGIGLQFIIGPLIAVVWKSLNNRMSNIEAALKDMAGERRAFVTTDDCDRQHSHLTQQVSLIVAPLEKKIDNLCNGGAIGGIQRDMASLDRRVAVIEANLTRDD